MAFPIPTQPIGPRNHWRWLRKTRTRCRRSGKAQSPEVGAAYVITEAYYNAAMQDAKDRIALAGARLAKLLNENLH